MRRFDRRCRAGRFASRYGSLARCGHGQQLLAEFGARAGESLIFALEQLLQKPCWSSAPSIGDCPDGPHRMVGERPTGGGCRPPWPMPSRAGDRHQVRVGIGSAVRHAIAAGCAPEPCCAVPQRSQGSSRLLLVLMSMVSTRPGNRQSGLDAVWHVLRVRRGSSSISPCRQRFGVPLFQWRDELYRSAWAAAMPFEVIVGRHQLGQGEARTCSGSTAPVGRSPRSS